MCVHGMRVYGCVTCVNVYMHVHVSVCVNVWVACGCIHTLHMHMCEYTCTHACMGTTYACVYAQCMHACAHSMCACTCESCSSGSGATSYGASGPKLRSGAGCQDEGGLKGWRKGQSLLTFMILKEMVRACVILTLFLHF